MSLIGISGRIGSGKDTVGRIIQWLTTQGKHQFTFEQFMRPDFDAHLVAGHTWEVKKFAGKLKQIVSLLTGIPVADLEKQEVKDKELGPEWWTFWNPAKFGTSTVIPYHPEAIKAMGGSGYIQKTTVREFLQRLGTNAMRDVVHPNLHVNALFADYKPYSQEAYIPDADSRMLGYTHPSCRSCKKQFNGYKVQSRCESCIKSDGVLYPNWLITDLRFPNELQAVEERGGLTVRIKRPAKAMILSDDSTLTAFGKQAKAEFLKEPPSETALDNAQFKYTIINDGSIEHLVEQVRMILTTENII
jgi:hypothetical protein